MKRDEWQDLDSLSAYFQQIGTPFDWIIRRRWLSSSVDGECAAETADAFAVKVRVASSATELAAAAELVATQYAWRGYQTASEGGPDGLAKFPGHFTLLACRGDSHVGTLTVGVDAENGLFLDDGNRETVDALRSIGRHVTEFIRLAVLDDVDPKRVLYQLFRTAYEYVRMLHKASDILIEVNPRHVSFYQKVFGFALAAGERICLRVNAPAILLRLDLAELDRSHGIVLAPQAAKAECEDQYRLAAA